MTLLFQGFEDSRVGFQEASLFNLLFSTICSNVSEWNKQNICSFSSGSSRDLREKNNEEICNPHGVIPGYGNSLLLNTSLWHNWLFTCILITVFQQVAREFFFSVAVVVNYGLGKKKCCKSNYIFTYINKSAQSSSMLAKQFQYLQLT